LAAWPAPPHQARGGPARGGALLPRRRRAARPRGRRRRRRPVTSAVLLAVLGSAAARGVAWLLGRRRSAERPRGLGQGPDHVAPADRFDGQGVDAGFAAQVRGYRMDQVDAVVDALESRLAGHDLAITRLRGDPAPPATAPPATVANDGDTAARH